MTTVATQAQQIVDRDVITEIAQLKKERNAVILAHNYQYGEIQDIADFVGDSLGLSQQAAHTDADVIIFCGVHFMAETAAILSPDKTILIPDLEAGCSLADSITADQLRAWKAEHPGAVVVSYINTTADIKAESDYCCTSGNAVKVVQSIPADRDILFLPDKFLGSYVQHITGRTLHIWDGECHVHAAITPDVIENVRTAHSNAEMIIHPECGCVTSCLKDLACKRINGDATHVLSTEGMIRHARQSTSSEFIVATETGVLHRMRKLNPTRTFYPISEETICRYMKLITVDKLLNTLRTMRYQVTVEPDVAAQARTAIERMLALA